MQRLDGKVVIITGGARGQGEAEAELAASEGAHVVVTDVLDAQGTAVAERIGGTYMHLDVTAVAGWNEVVEVTMGMHGHIDGLVNNAGVFRHGGILDSDVDTFRLVTEVNQIGVFNGMVAVAPAMKAAGSGSIVNISSIAGLRGYPGGIAYAASKWAVRGMTKSAAAELGRHGIRVNSIHPGFIDTEMLAQVGEVNDRMAARVPMKRVAESNEVAKVVMFLLSDDASYMSGAELTVDGAMSV